tara:strand:+ start:623 stop:1387 length:765 start_codon:yes stop_codon:yes gene_type:complete
VFLFLIAFLFGTRGAPRWSYAWIAIGIVATQALLVVTLPTDLSTNSNATIALAIFGPLLTAIISGTIAKNQWTDAFIFVLLYVMGTTMGLTIVLRQIEEGFSIPLELIRILILVIQTIVMSAAILSWNRNVPFLSLALLGAGILVSSVTAQFLLSVIDSSMPNDFSFIDLLRLTLLISLITFAIGSVRRIFSGKGFVAASYARVDLPVEESTERVTINKTRLIRNRRFLLSRNRRIYNTSRHFKFSNYRWNRRY